MTEAGGSDVAADWMAALEEAARLLEEGNSEGAALAMTSVTGRSTTVSSTGLSSEQAATARVLLDRCRQAEGVLRRKVADELAQSGASRRAQVAYDR